MDKRLNYGNWIRKRHLFGLGAVATVGLVLSLLPLWPGVRLVLAGVAAMGALSLAIPLAAYWELSQTGGRFQERLYRLIVAEVAATASRRVLDIGAGNGMLAIHLAQSAPDRHVVGVDTWGPGWEYARSVAEANADLADVAAHVSFQSGSAERLPFEDASFDAVVSNLTFHEVRAAPDKPALIREALRVLKPGGAFVFVDLFFDQPLYGDGAQLVASIRDLGISAVDLRPLRKCLAVPVFLRHPKALGLAGVLSGMK